ncbi:hypothetical protein HIMB5_00012060 [alpha proteobacterium HIMB5]|nr:hypothetical protein HIMB5_00012060 [alpha proteobacterium HIMB5]
MKYKITKANKNSSIYKEGFTVSPAKDYLKSKEEKGLKPIFFEKIGDKTSSRDQLFQNLIKALKKNGWKMKGDSDGKDN